MFVTLVTTRPPFPYFSELRPLLLQFEARFVSPVTHGSNPPSAEVLVTESRPSRGRGRGNKNFILA